jgi:ethanolamine utilization protein EutN
VFFVRGKEASFPWHPIEVPADAGIVGIIDHYTVPDKMILARVVGTVVSTQKRPQFEGAKLHAGAARDAQGEAKGATLLAIDSVGAGVSERVLVVLEGRAAGEALGKKLAPWTPRLLVSSISWTAWNERRRAARADSCAIQRHVGPSASAAAEGRVSTSSRRSGERSRTQLRSIPLERARRHDRV